MVPSLVWPQDALPRRPSKPRSYNSPRFLWPIYVRHTYRNLHSPSFNELLTT